MIVVTFSNFADNSEFLKTTFTPTSRLPLSLFGSCEVGRVNERGRLKSQYDVLKAFQGCSGHSCPLEMPVGEHCSHL